MGLVFLLTWAALAAAAAGAADGAAGEDRGREEHLAPEACGECHRSVYDGYMQTSHARAMRLVEPGLLDHQFAPEHEYFYVKKDTAGSAFFRLAVTEAGYEQQIFLPGETGAQELDRLPSISSWDRASSPGPTCAGTATGSSSILSPSTPGPGAGPSVRGYTATWRACREGVR